MPSAPPEPGPQPRPDPTLGVFETLLARDGQIQALGAHLRRLSASVAELYGARLRPGLADELRRHVADIAGERRLRVDVRPGEAGVDVEVSCSAVDRDRHSTVRCRAITVPGGLGPHKWADRRRLEQPQGRDVTALIVDSDGQLLEAAWANVWLIEGERLVTPPADGRLLAGVTRGLLLRGGSRLGLEAREEPVSLQRARAAAAIFLTSSLRHAVPGRLHHASGRAWSMALVDRIRAELSGLEWE